jgi:hypothetical protein
VNKLALFLVFIYPSLLLSAGVQDFDFGGNKKKQSALEYKMQKLKKEYEKFSFKESVPVTKIENNIDKAYKNKDKIVKNWKNFNIADSLVIVVSILSVILVFIIGFMIRNVLPNLAVILFLLSFFIYPLLSMNLQKYLNSFARKTEIENLNVKTFKYSSNIFLSGDIVNKGLYDYEECDINIVLYKKTDKYFKDLINIIRPLNETILKINKIKQGEFKNFSTTIYSVPKDVNFTTDIQVSCK